jgi:tetratricopeptide (TPR) repeat protein
MRSSICVFYIALFWLPAAAQGQTATAPAASQTAGDPDALYRDRANVASAKQAAAIWDARLKANASDFESAWKIARTMYWLGTHDAEPARRADLERGVEAGRKASMLEPKRPEGFFWMAADMGALAESFGMRQGLKYRGDIKEALETVLRLDPGFLDGSADRALGRWYFKVPGLFGGSNKKSEEHLRKSLTHDPNSIASHFFLAETLFDLNRDTEATDELKKVLAAPHDPDWEPEDREYKQKATELLKQKQK